MTETGAYKTIEKPAEGIYKEKGSKFIARAIHVETEEECKNVLSELKKEFHNARHHCYAWRIDPENEQFRSNDDGEPSGTAGKPILNQIYSFDLFNVMVVVIRYFGGTKLGTSGLITAYKTATREALSSAKVKKRFVVRQLELNFKYSSMNDVMRIIKEENLEIYDQNYNLDCVIKLTVKKVDLNRIKNRLKLIPDTKIKVLNH